MEQYGQKFKQFLTEGENISHEVYVVIPFYSGGTDIMENDIVVFKNFDAANRYADTLEGSPMIITSELR